MGAGATAAKAANDTTFVACIESGPLERQTVYLMESLRRFGGAFRNCPLVVVSPRGGPQLAKSTRATMARLGVEHVRFSRRGAEWTWFGFMNKPYAIAAVEERATTPYLAWVDSDMMFLNEPTGFLPRENEDFVACAGDLNLASSGPNDPNEPYWKKLLPIFGLTPEDMPWVTTEPHQVKVRMYWNAGMYAWRRSTGFAREYRDDCIRTLASKIVPGEHGVFYTDQVTLGITVARLKLEWRSLTHDYNYQAYRLDPTKVIPGVVEELRQAKLFHFHHALWPADWDMTLAYLRESRPEVHEWLMQFGPMRNPAAPAIRLLNKFVAAYRRRLLTAFQRSCHAVPRA